MAVYEYLCDYCGHRFDVIKTTNCEDTVCPNCGSFLLTRIWSNFNNHFTPSRTKEK